MEKEEHYAPELASEGIMVLSLVFVTKARVLSCADKYINDHPWLLVALRG